LLVSQVVTFFGGETLTMATTISNDAVKVYTVTVATFSATAVVLFSNSAEWFFLG
jgi:hypothetical protein